MFRNVMNDLAAWYETGNNKIALIKGGKSIGKSWVAIDFAKGFFTEHIIVDLQEMKDFSTYISKERTPEKIHAKLTTALDKYNFDEKLIIFDNVQVCPMAVKNLTEYAAYRKECRMCMLATVYGDLPYEKEYENRMAVFEMLPMTFDEFLKAGRGRKLCKYIENQKIEAIPERIKESINTMLEAFLLTGGMPESVNTYYATEDFEQVDRTLEEILDRFNRYLLLTVPKKYQSKVMEIWNSMPVQLTKKNKKFMYGYVNPKARAREYSDSVKALLKTGVVRQIFRAKYGTAPLSACEDNNSFKLYHLDHGLLRIMANLRYTDVDKSNIIDMLGGMIAEQYAFNELSANKNIGKLYFWISPATAKVDFVYEGDGEVFPVDVQTIPNTRAQSVNVFRRKYGNKTIVRISADDMFVKSGFLNIPLYGIYCF